LECGRDGQHCLETTENRKWCQDWGILGSFKHLFSSRDIYFTIYEPEYLYGNLKYWKSIWSQFETKIISLSRENFIAFYLHLGPTCNIAQCCVPHTGIPQTGWKWKMGPAFIALAHLRGSSSDCFISYLIESVAGTGSKIWNSTPPIRSKLTLFPKKVTFWGIWS
jgi:hypothetical protein